MRTSRVSSERGAVIIQVLVAFLALTGFMMFVVDYGIKWVGRNQAQNAADAGALAGAIALAFDNPGNLTAPASAVNSAHTFALANDIWGQDPSVDVNTDITFSAVSSAGFPTECQTVNCIRVKVYRNQARNNPLPMFFGSIVGLTDQGVRATAIAWSTSGNASKCMKPWAVADKWLESTGPWSPTQTFDPATGDVYTPPSGSDPGTGFTLANDLGTELRLKVGQPNDAINPGWFQALDLSPDSGGGASEYESYISGCSPYMWKIGDHIPKKTGDMVGPTGQGTGELIDLDPTADWDDVNKKVINSCVDTDSCVDANGDPIHYAESPRIVPVPVFNLAEYMATGGPGNGDVHIVNILGFFVDRIENPQQTVVGYLAAKSDMYVNGGGTITSSASFIKVIQLVR